MNDKVIAVNSILEDGEPDNISVDDHSGYTGYKPQSVVDAMNAVFWGEWGFEELSSDIIASDKGGLAVAQVKVWLKGVDFQPTGWGQNRVTRGDLGDARKGAQTDAIKKALSYFSVGNKAYHGLLDGKAQKAQAQKRATEVKKQPAQSNTSNHTDERTNVTVVSSRTQQSAPSTVDLKDYLQQAKDRALAARIATDKVSWQGFIAEELGTLVSEAKMTHEDIAKLHAGIARRTQPVQQAS